MVPDDAAAAIGWPDPAASALPWSGASSVNPMNEAHDEQ